MLDRIHLFVPFKKEEVFLLSKESSEEPVHMLKGGLLELGVPVQASISVDPETGEQYADHLRHPWESVSTGFTPMAMKIFPESMGKRAMPGVELKASPAKLLQGHNVFGPTSIRNGALVMLKWLAGTYPALHDKLDIKNAEVYDIDCTFSARLPDERTALQAIEAIRGVSNGQTKGRGDDYQTTAYFGSKDSRLRRLKIYLKHPEFMRQLEEAKKNKSRAGRRTYKVMSDKYLQDWTKGLLRLEATVTKRWLNRRGIPNKLIDLCAYQDECEAADNCLIQWCWEQVTQELFAAFEGQTMRIIHDDKILLALKDKHVRYNKDGNPTYTYALNLFRTYRSIKDYGWEETAASMSRASFHRHVKDICMCGVSKAALQKLKQSDQTNNVVPILRFMAVDFGAQRPSWYVEPRVEAA